MANLCLWLSFEFLKRHMTSGAEPRERNYENSLVRKSEGMERASESAFRIKFAYLRFDLPFSQKYFFNLACNFDGLIFTW